MTLQAFIERYHVKMETQWVSERPDKLMGDMSTHWKCVLRCGPRRMTVYFSQGSAHTQEPELAEVLDCMASDASGYENAKSFEDWASEYGYDTDSRKAERTFNAVQAQAENLKRLFSLGDAYTDLLWHTERL